MAENAARGGHCCLTASELLEVLEKASGPLHVPGSFTPSKAHALSAIDGCLSSGSIRGLRTGDRDLEDLLLFAPCVLRRPCLRWRRHETTSPRRRRCGRERGDRQHAVDATARRWLDASERSIASAVEMRIPPEGAREAELKAAKDDQLPGEHRLSDEQRTIVALAAKQPLSILAGGPGTGKTFAAKFVVRSRRPVV